MKNWQKLILLLKATAKGNGITHQVIADRTGIQKTNVTRFFSGKVCPTLDTTMKIAKAIGVQIEAKKRIVVRKVV